MWEMWKKETYIFNLSWPDLWSCFSWLLLNHILHQPSTDNSSFSIMTFYTDYNFFLQMATSVIQKCENVGEHHYGAVQCIWQRLNHQAQLAMSIGALRLSCSFWFHEGIERTGSELVEAVLISLDGRLPLNSCLYGWVSSAWHQQTRETGQWPRVTTFLACCKFSLLCMCFQGCQSDFEHKCMIIWKSPNQF